LSFLGVVFAGGRRSRELSLQRVVVSEGRGSWGSSLQGAVVAGSCCHGQLAGNSLFITSARDMHFIPD
jgi:hypothetical protein